MFLENSVDIDLVEHSAKRTKCNLVQCRFSVQGVTITPHKWVPITSITPLFERAVDLYNTRHSKNAPKLPKTRIIS